ncbi:hypothetical protein pdul_cds_724 [Pandoravirus dulcis]|uniref:Uncharacterized protein n=1 Tax=Pandoravirus dulcis TaxID=1349409 RepID=S4VTZ5_9VIRU|nr:hypothetical protein pdul_cds_724 [Pandoravirus dulcis]AGO82890.1 hypothetical protein pdul_cds_724 [Pandoravirus dulcis]
MATNKRAPAAVGLFVIVAVAMAAAEAPPRSGCGARAYADSCVDACCAWCPAAAANASVITPASAVDANDGAPAPTADPSAADGSTAATAKGSCHERGRAPCGPNAIMRPASECYIELAVSVGSVFGVIALAMAACYARRRWVRRRAKHDPGRPSRGGRARPHSRTLTMIDIPYAQSADGALIYYASPYALAGDVERAVPLIDSSDDESESDARCSSCRRPR